MITKIIMDGIKGQKGEQELTGKDIIVGRNGAGKTTRMQAMSLAAFGYVPGKGKTAAETFELASDDTMTVGIETEDFSADRTFKKKSTLKKNGSLDIKISQEIFISPNHGENTIKQKEQRISDEIGDFSTMLDFSAFIELTDNKKREFIYNLNGGKFTWDKDRVADFLRNEVLRQEIAEINPEMYEVMLKDYEDTMSQYKPKADVQSGLLAMTEHAKEQLSYWKREKVSAEAAARKLTEIKNRSKDTDRELKENIEKLKELESEKEDAVKQCAAQERQNQHVESRIAEKEKLQEEIDDLKAMSEDSVAIDTLSEEITLKQTEIFRIDSEIQEKNKKLAEAEERKDTIKDRIDEAVKYKGGLAIEKAKVKTRIEEMSKQIDRIQEYAGKCPLCEDITCDQDHSSITDRIQKEIDAAYIDRDEIDVLFNSSVETLNQLDEEHKAARREADTIRSELTSLQHVRNQIQSEIKKIEKQSLTYENANITIAARLAQIQEIEAWLTENPSVDITDLKEESKRIAEQIETLRSTIEEQKRVRNDIMNIKANIIDSKTAAYEQECWSQITEALGQKGVQGEIVKEMLDPIREDIDEKLAAIGLDHQFYFDTESDRGKEIFRFGWIQNEEKRPFNALSQGEQLLLLIAMMTTIIERNDPPVKILAIDNLNDLDAENMSKVIRGLNIAGANMDNIILSGVNEPKEEDTDGWTVWRI